MIKFTSIKRQVAGAIELLLLLKKRQNIEDFFAYKNGINADHIFVWAFLKKRNSCYNFFQEYIRAYRIAFYP
ncbi:MAG: hypothetical protein GF329_20145 [Candidatus Lokiarchaeota archaeon]|nr:hypothetical protein [Candidatus Lokiarchaeota archaeon]